MVTASPAEVVIDAEPVGVDEIVDIAYGSRVALGPAALQNIQASRNVVDRLVSGPDLIYGLNTGLGHMRNERVPLDSLRAYQPAILAMHDGAIGPPLPAQIVRAAMATRVAGIARGGSGASLAVAQTLVAMLNAKVHPIVPRTGSVGASDLMHMAAIGLVVIGAGSADYLGEVVDGAEALRRAGIASAVLEPKDGLALVSANGMSVGHAALLTARAERSAQLADVVLAVSLEAFGGNLSIIDPVVARAKRVPGQEESATFIRALLAGSARGRPGAGGSVQDPLSFRVGPQVHGALRETIGHLRREVDIELAAIDDNPLVDVDSGRIISNGNFHPLAMALAADALRPAVAHVGQLSDRRLNQLWTMIIGSVDVSDVAPPELRGLLLRYASAVRYAELRDMSSPVTLDIAPLDLGVEDHATNAVVAVQRSEEALEVLDDLFTVELFMAFAELRRAAVDRGTLGRGVAAALAVQDDIDDALGAGARGNDLHAALKGRLYSELLVAATQAASAPA